MKKRKTVKKMALNRETLRRLGHRQLQDVVGGNDTSFACIWASGCACPTQNDTEACVNDSWQRGCTDSCAPCPTGIWCE
jgi:hypothetical protein